MTRNLYGPAAVLSADGGLARSAVGTVWADRSQSTQITDLAALPGGASVPTVTSSAEGYCSFYGPDGTRTTLWVDFGAGPLPISAFAAVDDAINGLVGSTSVADLSVTTQKLADAAVTGVKIANETITPGKLDRQYIGLPSGLTTGDLLVFNGLAIVRQPGSTVTGQVLTPDPTSGTGYKWAAPATSGGTARTGYSTVIGDGASVRYTVTHGLNTYALTLQAWSAVTPRGQLAVEVVDLPSLNEAVLQFGSAPAASSVRVVVVPAA